jgi:hypothetical protein
MRPDKGYVEIQGVKLIAKNREVVGAAKRIDITSLTWKTGAQQNPVIDVYGLFGSITRYSDGHLQVLDLLPPGQSTSGSSTPYRVHVHGADVKVVDLRGTPFRQRVKGNLINVCGVGANWVANGTGTLPGLGPLQATLSYATGVGLTVDGTTSGLRSERLLDHLLSDRSLRVFDRARGTQVKSLLAKGTFHLFIPHDLNFTFHARVQAVASGISYQNLYVDRVTFAGDFGKKGAVGHLTGKLGPNTFEARGSLLVSKDPEANLLVSGNSPSAAALPLDIRQTLPTGLGYSNAKFTGWVGGAANGKLRVQGDLTAEAVTDHDQKLLNPRLKLSLTNNLLRADLVRTTYAGAVPSGSVLLDLHTKLLTVYLAAHNVRLEPFAALAKVDGLSGQGSVSLIANGPASQPKLDFLAEANGRYQHGKLNVGPDHVWLAGNYQGHKLFVQRGAVTGVDGIFGITGGSSPQTSSLSSFLNSNLNMDIEGRGIQLSRFSSDISGIGSFSANVTGDLANPTATGSLRGTDLQFRSQLVPLAAAKFSASRREVALQDISAISGSVDLEGGVKLFLPNKKIQGNLAAHGLQLAQYFGDTVAGKVDVPTIQLTGDLKDPRAVARLAGTGFIVGDLFVDSAEALVIADKKTVQLDHATANLANGSLSATGLYDIPTKSGSGVITSTAFDLEQLTPVLGQTLSLAGTGSITEAKVSIRDKTVTAVAKGKLDKIVANDAPVGDGNWTLNLDGDSVHGNLSIGEVQPVFRAVDLDATYNLKTKLVSGTFETDRAPLADLAAASERYLPESFNFRSLGIQNLSGDLTLGAKFDGPVTSPNVSVDTISAENLGWLDDRYGTLTVSNLMRKDGVWTVPSLALVGPAGTITGSGRIVEHGDIDATLSATRLQLGLLAAFAPSLKGSHASASFHVKASGASQAPDLLASAELQDLVPAPKDSNQSKTANPPSDQNLSVKLSKIELRNGSLSLQGTYGFDGFAGTLQGSAPFNFQTGFENSSLSARATLDPRDLTKIPILDSVIDATRSKGSVSGILSATGTIHDVHLSGGFDLNADNLALKVAETNPYIKRVDDQFKSVKAKLSITPSNDVTATLSASASKGGAIAMQASANLAGLESIVDADKAKFNQSIMDSPLSGLIKLEDFSFRQSVSGGYVAGIASGQVPISGTFKAPAVGTAKSPGTFQLSNLDSSLPAVQLGSGAPSVPSINPSFNVNALLKTPAHFHTQTAELTINGGGSLAGTLADPQAKADLTVASGTVRLPGGIVRLADGGTIKFGYQRTFPAESSGSLDVDLQGRTSVNAIRYGQTSQRYEVTVYITGDILQANGLHFDAYTDPPDLSPNDVLALLGQKNLVESLSTGDQSEAEQRLRDALVGFALPGVLDTYTNSLARSLGLEYISLDYNPINLATVGTALALSNDFTLQYRQQLGTPAPGYRAIYDFRLVFSPRKGPPALRRFSFSVGTDQDRPYKFALEYGFRFGGYSGPTLTNKTVISSPTKP